jgi:hypothetical protein
MVAIAQDPSGAALSDQDRAVDEFAARVALDAAETASTFAPEILASMVAGRTPAGDH